MPFSATPTYAELKAEVQLWLDRDDADTIARIPTFIRYAHDEIVRSLRLPLSRKVTSITLNAERVALPADFTAARALEIAGTYQGELQATTPGLRASHAAVWSSGQPTEYSIEQAMLALAPIPGSAYVASLVYDATPLLMSADGDTNPIFAKTPFVYLEGALAAGFLFNQFAQEAQLYESKFRATLADMQMRLSADAMSGPLRLSPSMGFAP